MSYDMMVFEASAAPREAAAFIAWFEKQTQWNERHEYDDPAVSSSSLQAWFAEMAREFPPMNGPLSNDDDDRAGLLTAGSSYSWRSFHCVCFSNQAMKAAASRGAALASNTIMS